MNTCVDFNRRIFLLQFEPRKNHQVSLIVAVPYLGPHLLVLNVGLLASLLLLTGTYSLPR
jgi:hypothetical protein